MVTVGIFVLGGTLFFVWLSYTSPVNEAGREYAKNVRSYKNVEIETMDDVFERLEVLDSHFDSTTFHKVQGGDKREVTLSDIQTLFGEPNQTIENVDMNDANTVYQYHYGDITLNVHEGFSDVNEYVIENYTEVLYEPQALDRLFIDTMINHQSQYNKVDGEFEPISEENISKLQLNKTATRKIQQSGWSTRSLTKQHYFDDGSGSYSPEEYLLLHFKRNREDVTELLVMERGYSESYVEKDTKEEVERKEKALFHFMEERESGNSDKKFMIEDFSREFGEITSIIYDFRDGTLSVSWLIKDEEDTEEIMATVPITDTSQISDIHDLAGLEVVDFRFQMVYRSGNEFIGSK